MGCLLVSIIHYCLYRFTYEVSPVFILIEEILLKKMQGIVGWSDDEGDGLFCPGKTCEDVTAEMTGRMSGYLKKAQHKCFM